MDQLFERLTRRVAQRTSRRGFLARVGKLIVGGIVLPLLPLERLARAAESPAAAEPGDPNGCDYWRYCAIDGYLCGCCGGGTSECPPGTTAAPSSWVGTCKHPVSGKDYIVSYRDCCGKNPCGRCLCTNNEGEMPVYRPQLNSDLVWCFGANSMVYHCTTADIIGVKS
jgi:methylamine dehydrogenase light chain